MMAHEFALVRRILKEQSGLNLGDDKQDMLEGKLRPLLREFSLPTLSHLVLAMTKPEAHHSRSRVAQAVTVQESYFFRDNVPFNYFIDVMLSKLMASRQKEHRIRVWCAAAATGQADAAAGVDAGTGTTLLQLPPAEVLRLGLVSNRGLIVIGGGFAALSQFNARLLSNLFEGWGRALFGWAGQQHFGIEQFALAGASLLLAFLLLLRLFSIALALLQYYGFRLERHGRRLTVERGLLTRERWSLEPGRDQAWTLREGLLHR